MKIGRWIVAALLVGGIAWGAASRQTGGTPDVADTSGPAARERDQPAPPPAPAPAEPEVDDSTVRAPAGVRIRVQVTNATTTRGLARRATRWLRDGGYDVVDVGTTREMRDSTLVLDRSGHPDWAARVARAMGGARVESRPDSSRYLDLTVLVGRSWRAPSQALDP